MQLAIKFSHWQAILPVSPKKVVLKGYDILLFHKNENKM